MTAETRVEKPLPMYVPRDEHFEESKKNTFSTSRLKAVLHNLVPSLMATISPKNPDFKGFGHIDSLYSEGLLLKLGLQEELWQKLPMPNVISRVQGGQGNILKYDTPKIASSEHYLPSLPFNFTRLDFGCIH